MRGIEWRRKRGRPIPRIIHVMAENEQSLAYKYVTSNLFTLTNYITSTSHNLTSMVIRLLNYIFYKEIGQTVV